MKDEGMNEGRKEGKKEGKNEGRRTKKDDNSIKYSSPHPQQSRPLPSGNITY